MDDYLGTIFQPVVDVTSTDGLLDALLQHGFLSDQDVIRLRTAQEATGETIRTLILRLGLTAEEELVRNLATLFGVECYLEDRWSLDVQPDLDLENDYLLDMFCVPLEALDGSLALGMVDPTDFWIQQAISIKTGLSVQPIPMLEEQFQQVSAALQSADDKVAKSEASLLELSQDDVHRLTDLASDAPVVHLVETLFSKSIQQGASDIHLTAMQDGLRVRYRIDGSLREQFKITKSRQMGVISRLKILSGLDISEQRIPQDGRISTQIAGEKIDIRVSTMPQIDGEGAVLRLLRRSANHKALDELGIPAHISKPLLSILSSPEGLFLVTGPTGSGKTTTLYAALKEITCPELSISTIEDPVENRIDGIAQIQVNPSAGLSFSTALRSLLRQDPDIVMVGEIRDVETAKIANRAALTGHLVLSTLHTDGAAGAVPRLLDMGIESYLLSSTLKGVMAQRLLPRLCPDCKTHIPFDHHATAKIEAYWGARDMPLIPKTHAYSNGCSACHNTGYSGRVLICELLQITNEIQSALREKNDTLSIKQIGYKDGFRPMADEAIDHLINGEVSLGDVLRLIPPAGL